MHSDESFETVLAEYLDAVANGGHVDRDRFLQAHVAWANELTEFFDNHDRFCQMAQEWHLIEETHSGTSLPVPGSAIAAELPPTLGSSFSSPHEDRNSVTGIRPSAVSAPVRWFGNTDFGLAKREETDPSVTAAGQILGTASYMSPEQASGLTDRIGPASDVYSIGALLYALLTGQPPFRGRDTLETLSHVRERDPQLPRQLNPRVPRELELICLKCLEKNPADRYATAGELAHDLQRYLDGESISISGPHLLHRLVRVLERSHHDVEFRTWARMLVHFAWIVCASNAFIFVMERFQIPVSFLWFGAVRAVEFVGMGLIFWLFRLDWYPPCGKPSRQLWALWLGYVAGSVVFVMTELATAAPGSAFEQWRLYPKLAVLGSLGFIMMGSSYWGYCYVIGACFLAPAILMPLNPPLAPLAFGVAWGASLLALARHLGRLSKFSL